DRRNLERMGRDRAQQRQVQAQLAALRDRALAKIGPSGIESAEPPRPLASQPTGQTPPSIDAASSPAETPPAPGGRDLQFLPSRSGGTGGGALDPISGGIALTLAALGLAAR